MFYKILQNNKYYVDNEKLLVKYTNSDYICFRKIKRSMHLRIRIES